MNQQLDLFTATAAPFETLEQARVAASGCVRCELSTTRQRVVFGIGASTARLVVVGEGPSEADDASGRPFSGPTGRLLEHWLAEIGLQREQVWLTNVVRCRPAALEGGRLRNRPPRSAEIAACRLWLDTELSLLTPVAILCLGATPARVLLGKDFKISRDRGRWGTAANGVPCLATYNPAYVLRLEGADRERAEAEVAVDLHSVRDRLGT